MINTEDATSLKVSLCHLIALKNDPENSEFINGAISMAERMHALISNRGNSKEYETAFTAFRDMGRNMRDLKIERQNKKD